MQDAWTPERRRGGRRAVPFPLYARTHDGALRVRVRELGPGGVVIECDRPLTAGESLLLTIDADGGDVGPIAGHVAHSRLLINNAPDERPPYLAGVTFARLPATTATRLAALLDAIDMRIGGSDRHDVP